MPYWLNSTFAALPAILWMIFGLGLPYALAVLPHKMWRNYPLIAMTALGVGPAILTVWMFVLGTIGGAETAALLTLPIILLGTLVLALIGWGLVLYKSRDPLPPMVERDLLAFDERLIIAMIVAACAIRWLTTSYWNFTEYDPLWVYGYQGRLYTLLGYIPTDIGYYPPLVQLQYVYTQLAATPFTGLVIDDHAARAVVPLWHLGSILAAFILGKHLFNRRVGIFTAGIWALYPHLGMWAHAGDLEIPLVFAFTAAASFFLSAWLSEDDRLHNAALAGLFLGIAMWTKPTAGAFIFGVALLTGIEIVRAILGDSKSLRIRLEVVAVTALACIPLGALWYIRNISLGFEPITLPHPFWLTQALRSGSEFGWLLLALILGLVYVGFAPLSTRPNRRWLVIGLVLIFAAVMPTILVPYDPPGIPNRMDWLEWLLLAAGSGMIGLILGRYADAHAAYAVKRKVVKVGWALALGLPYFITWFYSYSYHYRLSFAIVPLMILPSAVILAKWTELTIPWQKKLYPLGLMLIGLPGIVIPLYNFSGGWDWLWSNEYPDDFARLEATNLALAWTVRSLKQDMGTTFDDPIGGDKRVIVAPGLQRLPFFFPLHDVRIDVAPTDLDELSGVDYYVYTQESAWFYPENRLPIRNQVIGSFARVNVLELLESTGDRSFWSRLYRVREPDRRFREPRRLDVPPAPVQFGDFTLFAGSRLLGGETLSYDNPPILQLNWHAQKAAPGDYSIYVHLLDSDGNLITNWDAPPAQNEFTYYSTMLWDADEYIIEQRLLSLPETVPPGDYRIRIGFYDLTTLERIPVLIGDRQDDGYMLPGVFTVPAAK